MIYLLIYIVELLGWLVYGLLAIGVPLLIAVMIYRNRTRRGRMAMWIMAAVVWAIPSVVEHNRDRVLAGWVATLPPAPVVELPQGAMLGLVGGVYDPDYGVVHFGGCPDNRWQRPLCQFELGAREVVQGYRLAVSQGDGWQTHNWVRGTDCPLDLKFPQLSEPFEAYFIAQGICHVAGPLAANVGLFDLAYQTDTLPGFSDTYYGRITVTEGRTGKVLTTLTSFAVDRPVYPVLWGVHWGRVLGAFTPRRTQVMRHGDTLQETFHLGQPRNSVQHLAYSIGWDGDKRSIFEIHQALERKYGYEANRALPALSSDWFFPTRYALETVCSDLFRDRVTPEVIAQIERIITSDVRFSNGYPKRLAREVLEDGCGSGL